MLASLSTRSHTRAVAGGRGMPNAMLSQVSGGWTSEMWLWLVVPIAIYCGVSLSLFVAGHSHEEPENFVGFFFREISDSLNRLTGFPGWAMAGVLTGLMFL